MPRPTLRLPKHKSSDAIEDRFIDISTFDVLLPCRFFGINYKVAEIGRVSMTTEFLLRLLRAVDGMDEVGVGAFFGFDQREMAFVLAEVETNDYVERTDGRLWLTATGRGLFRDTPEEPQIFDVERRTERVGFDLLALAPQERRPLLPFDLTLPELQVRDSHLVATATSRIADAFRRHFPEIALRRTTQYLKKRSLYSIDDVAAGDRFSSVISIVAKSSTLRPGFPEPDLSAWRSDLELDDRTPIVESIATFMDGLRVDAKPGDSAAYEVLLELAPEFLDDFVSRGAFAVERFYKGTLSRVGEFRVDRPTVAIVGSLFTPDNNRRIAAALAYAIKARAKSVDGCVWLVPEVAWGLTRVLPLTLKTIARQTNSEAIGEGEVDRFCGIAIVRGKPDRHISEAFNFVETRANLRGVPPALELFVVPGLIAGAVVHTPIRAQSAFPVPMGIISFDRTVVVRVQRYLLERLPYVAETNLDAASPNYTGLLDDPSPSGS